MALKGPVLPRTKKCAYVVLNGHIFVIIRLRYMKVYIFKKRINRRLYIVYHRKNARVSQVTFLAKLGFLHNVEENVTKHSLEHELGEYLVLLLNKK